MKRFGILLALFFFSAASWAGAKNKIQDELGYSTTLKSSHAARIVTLMPALAEIVADITGGDLSRIVGVSDRTDYPPVLKTVRSVASYSGINLEAVMALKPDLVIASADGNAMDQVTHLRELGVPVIVVKSSSLRDIEQSIDLIGRAMGDAESAQAVLARFRAGEEQIRDHAKLRNLHPSVMLEISDNPLIVVGKNSFLNEAIELVGAKNIFSDLSGGYPRPALEEAVRRDPDVIVIPSDQPAPSPNNGQINREATVWRQFPKMKAVANGKIKTVHSEALARPSPRILQGIIALEHAIFGQ